MNVFLTASTIFFTIFFFPATLILRNNSPFNPILGFTNLSMNCSLSVMNFYTISFCMVMF